MLKMWTVSPSRDGVPPAAGDDEERRLVFVLGKVRRRDDVGDALAVRRDLHVDDRAQLHQIVDGDRPLRLSCG